jgi:hypothetical protein
MSTAPIVADAAAGVVKVTVVDVLDVMDAAVPPTVTAVGASPVNVAMRVDPPSYMPHAVLIDA